MSDTFEPIYAFMITGKDPVRLPLAQMAVNSFAQQSYPNKKLVIVDDGGFEFDLDGLDAEHVRVERGMTLGELRNVSLDAVPDGAVWVQWDDDDWRDPTCIAEQYDQLGDAGAVVLKNQIQFLVRAGRSWVVTRKSGIEGTIMARKNHVRYPPMKRSEDSVFRDRMKRAVKWRVWDNPAWQYIRLIHGANTWPEGHFVSPI